MTRQGFSLIEAILASALFGLLVTGIVGTLAVGQQSAEFAGRRNRALFLAQETLEAARNLRDSDMTLLLDGTYGLAIVNNQWTFSGSSDSVDGFTRALTISSIDANTKQITATVNWPQSIGRDGNVSIVTHMTNWRMATQTAADTVNIDVNGATVGGSGKSEVQGVEIENFGSMAAIIDKITVSWTKPNQNIKEIKIDSTVVWSNNGPGAPTGTQSSATELDVQNVTIPAGENDYSIDRIKMTGNAEGDTFTLQLKFTDGSVKQVTFTPGS
ncbi:hypothetical protein HZA86_04080 [Candidatus Uhrbacteria bacterium]|nr:hypothetical protein [Candidatus Uhrbacteria bacterium]